MASENETAKKYLAIINRFKENYEDEQERKKFVMDLLEPSDEDLLELPNKNLSSKEGFEENEKEKMEKLEKDLQGAEVEEVRTIKQYFFMAHDILQGIIANEKQKLDAENAEKQAIIDAEKQAAIDNEKQKLAAEKQAAIDAEKQKIIDAIYKIAPPNKIGNDFEVSLPELSVDQMKKVLGLQGQENLAQEDVDKAFRVRSLLLHPDKLRHMSQDTNDRAAHALSLLTSSRDEIMPLLNHDKLLVQCKKLYLLGYMFTPIAENLSVLKNSVASDNELTAIFSEFIDACLARHTHINSNVLFAERQLELNILQKQCIYFIVLMNETSRAKKELAKDDCDTDAILERYRSAVEAYEAQTEENIPSPSNEAEKNISGTSRWEKFKDVSLSVAKALMGFILEVAIAVAEDLSAGLILRSPKSKPRSPANTQNLFLFKERAKNIDRLDIGKDLGDPTPVDIKPRRKSSS